MKVIFFLLFIVLFSTLSIQANDKNKAICENANEYKPFIEDGKQWILVSATNVIYWVKTFYISTDTVINNHPCKKLMCKFENYQEEKITNILHSYIFENNKQVYYYPAGATDSSNPIQLYDFNAKPNEKVTLGGQKEDMQKVDCYIIWKELSLNDGQTTFRGQLATLDDPNITYADENSDLPLYEWYESIGSYFNPFEKKSYNKYMGGVEEWLYECKVNGNVIYSKKMGIELPNSIRSTECNISKTGLRYTIDGKPIKDNYFKGIYIEEGNVKISR